MALPRQRSPNPTSASKACLIMHFFVVNAGFVKQSVASSNHLGNNHRATMATAYFQPAFFRFLKDLERHNNRAWFVDNKSRFEKDVKDPMAAFIADLAPKLAKVSRHITVDPKRSLFRIHRDVRFSPDKSPYKDHMAAHFSHERGMDLPGFYLRLGPGNGLCGAGLWRPESPALARVRDAICSSPAGWKRAKKGLRLDGEPLKRAPRGYDPEHPLIQDLKRKDFITGSFYSAAEVCKPGFLNQFAGDCRKYATLVRFLCGALKLNF
jgi:uncharacterized protein (TIGR02453 family)